MCNNPLKELNNRIYRVKSVLLSLFLFGIIIIGTFSPIFAYIPPTVAYDNITASNGSAMAQTYDSHINFQGLRGMQVFASNNSQTIYFNATLSNGTKITPITCSSNYQLHSINSLGIFTCALNNNTGGPALDTMQNLTPAQAYVYAKNSTDFNFQFRGINFTGSLTGSNSSNLITIHGNIYQNNTGTNLGAHGIGIYSSMSGAVLQFIKLLGGQGISVTSNSTNAIISTNFKVNNQTCSTGYFVSAYDNKTGNYICTQDSDPFLTSAVLSINGNTNAAQTINSSLPIVTTNSGAVHTLSCPTCNTRTNQGTYNTTQANNVNINSAGYQLNFINGTGNPIRVQNSHSSNQVNVTISSNSNGITSINSQSGPAVGITCTSGNTTCTNSTNQIKINTGNNLGYLAKTQTYTGINTFTKVIQASQNGSAGNTGFGTGALNLNHGVNFNSAFGNDALFQITTGNTSSAFGALALFSSTSGFKNTALGAGALEDIMGGSNNIGIGYNAGTSYTGSESNNIIIGASGTSGENSTLRIGNIIVGNLLTNAITSKMKLTNTASTIGLNLGTVSSFATSPRQGDIEIVGNSIKFQDNTNTTQTITPSSYLTSGTGVTQVNTFTNKVNITRQIGNTTISNNTGIISIGFGVNPVIIGGAYQDITKGLQIDKLNDTSKIVSGKDTTKAITFLNSGMTTGITTTFRNNATSSQSINIPATRETETLAIRPTINYTTPSNPATTTSTTGVMSNLFATFTPQVTGRIFIDICGGLDSGTAGDGAGFDIRYGTSPISEGTAIGNTVVGTKQIITSSTLGKFQSACSIGYVTGLGINTKYYVQIGKYAATAGTASFQNFETYIEEK